MGESDRCGWYGVSCDEEGYVTEILLGGNNLEGDFPADLLSKSYKLRSLDLSNNRLKGTMAGQNDENGLEDTSVYFRLSLVAYIFSRNVFGGEDKDTRHDILKTCLACREDMSRTSANVFHPKWRHSL